MRIVLFSDLHAHPFKPYATILPDGMNSRLADAVRCITQIREYAVRTNADLVLFGGDMFHVRRTISVQAFNAVYEEMAKFRLEGIPVVMIHGNHDQADRDGNEHSIHAFRTFSTIIDTPSWVYVEDKNQQPCQLLAVPYMENIEMLRDLTHNMPDGTLMGTPRLFLGHLGIQGAKVGADFVYENPHDATIGDLNMGVFDAGFLGHYHMPQTLGQRFWYIGAPLQHNWGDCGQPRGFVCFDTTTKLYEFVRLDAPKFLHYSAPFSGAVEQHITDATDSFVRITDQRVWSDDEREETRQRIGARTLEILPPTLSMPSQRPGPRIELNAGLSFQDMVSRYVASGVQPADGLDLDYLVQLGTEIFAEVDNEQ